MEPLTFPQDLVQAQHDWIRTYETLAQPHPRHLTALRRRLLHLADYIWRHPFFMTFEGSAAAARVELRRQARWQEHGVGAAREAMSDLCMTSCWGSGLRRFRKSGMSSV